MYVSMKELQIKTSEFAQINGYPQKKYTHWNYHSDIK